MDLQNSSSALKIKEKDSRKEAHCCLSQVGFFINWFFYGRRTFNIKKTCTVIFQINRKPSNYNQKLNNELEQSVKGTTFLVMPVDCQLKWDKHVTILRSKISKASYALCILSSVCDTQCIKAVYYANIQ